MSRTKAIAVAGLLVLGACSDDGPPEREAGLEPTFAPAEGASGETSTTAAATATTGADGASPTTTAAGGGTTSPAEVPTTSASVDDPAGDATASPIDPPPAWADLLGARLTRSQSGFELRIRLAGGDAPESTPDGDHTMNLASFYDVDGDGTIDYEVWANIAEGGWGASYFDNDAGTGSFMEESHVEVTTEGDEVVLRFALLHLDRAERFRWSIASEWGRYEAIGTPAMVRDEAPDDDGAADFPAS